MELIKAKINQLEMEISVQEALNTELKTLLENLEESIVPIDLIPFLMMYMCLNYDLIFPNNSIKNRKQNKSSAYYCRKNTKEGQLQKKIDMCTQGRPFRVLFIWQI